MNFQITAFPRPKCTLLLADAEAIKVRPVAKLSSIRRIQVGSQEVMTSRFKFPKPVDHYAVLRMFGPNIIASEGEEWKKYRRIAAPAFSEVIPGHTSSPKSEYHH